MKLHIYDKFKFIFALMIYCIPLTMLTSAVSAQEEAVRQEGGYKGKNLKTKRKKIKEKPKGTNAPFVPDPETLRLSKKYAGTVPENERKLKRVWQQLKSDGLHDPKNPALKFIQEPAEVLSKLPHGGLKGNKVDWVDALREGYIAPRTSLYENTEVKVLDENTEVKVLDLDIYFQETKHMPWVRFPHKEHTEWLDCSNCHDKIFIPKRGANKIGMLDVLNGKFCGQCHGAIAFPLTQCKRCHSTSRNLKYMNVEVPELSSHPKKQTLGPGIW